MFQSTSPSALLASLGCPRLERLAASLARMVSHGTIPPAWWLRMLSRAIDGRLTPALPAPLSYADASMLARALAEIEFDIDY